MEVFTPRASTKFPAQNSVVRTSSRYGDTRLPIRRPVFSWSSGLGTPPPAPVFLLAQFFDTFHLRRNHPCSGFDPLKQFAASQTAVDRLAPLPHAGCC